MSSITDQPDEGQGAPRGGRLRARRTRSTWLYSTDDPLAVAAQKQIVKGLRGGRLQGHGLPCRPTTVASTRSGTDPDNKINKKSTCVASTGAPTGRRAPPWIPPICCQRPSGADRDNTRRLLASERGRRPRSPRSRPCRSRSSPTPGATWTRRSGRVLPDASRPRYRDGLFAFGERRSADLDRRPGARCRPTRILCVSQ